ncbi:hypothetical protein PDR5_22950 [Pseudomonas sp. DR 5-09]|nr:hypothetical protein PDR5_22950 [Pseudomonas sp. DR 5-09]
MAGTDQQGWRCRHTGRPQREMSLEHRPQIAGCSKQSAATLFQANATEPRPG